VLIDQLLFTLRKHRLTTDKLPAACASSGDRFRVVGVIESIFRCIVRALTALTLCLIDTSNS